jgi:seryl-tRNA synthetase
VLLKQKEELVAKKAELITQESEADSQLRFKVNQVGNIVHESVPVSVDEVGSIVHSVYRERCANDGVGRQSTYSELGS